LNDHVVQLAFPGSRHDLVALVYRTGRILATQYEDNLIKIAAQIPARTRSLLAPFLVG